MHVDVAVAVSVVSLYIHWHDNNILRLYLHHGRRAASCIMQHEHEHEHDGPCTKKTKPSALCTSTMHLDTDTAAAG